MGVIRVHSSSEYIVPINRRALEDNRLSLRARGLLAFLMTKPKDWRINYRGLMTTTGEGQHVILKALTNLGENGYLTRSQSKGEDGRWDWDYDIFDYPDENRALIFHARKNRARRIYAVSNDLPTGKEISNDVSKKPEACSACGVDLRDGVCGWCKEETA